MNEVDELLLEHFGTKGMKWGVRKTPEQVQAIRNTKAKKYEDKAKNIQSEIDRITQGGGRYKDIKISELRRDQYDALDDAKRKREGKLSKNQKKVVIGASIATVLAASYITYSSIQSGNARRLSEKGKDFVMKKQGLPWKLKPELRNSDLDVDGVFENVVKPINPKYGLPGTKMNCRRATYAYEMRRRGYDVAATRTTNARGQDITGVFNVSNPNVNLVPAGKTGIVRLIGERNKPQKPFTELLKTPGSHLGKEVYTEAVGMNVRNALARQPNGARGELSGAWLHGLGAHSVAWERFKDGPVVFDAQSGRKYVGDEIQELASGFSQAGITRLDNSLLNNDFLRRWVKNA